MWALAPQKKYDKRQNVESHNFQLLPNVVTILCEIQGEWDEWRKGSMCGISENAYKILVRNHENKIPT